MPPLGLAVALPVFPPLQPTFVFTLAVVDKAPGWVMLTLAVAEQLFASVMVTV